MANTISNMDDVIDSRDIIARIGELEAERGDLADAFEEADKVRAELSGKEDHEAGYASADVIAVDAQEALKAWDRSDEAEELEALLALQEELEGYCEDWNHGVTLIRDSYFEDYAQEFAEDIGAISKNAEWPNNHIDWEAAARSLQMDYTSGEFDGITYWAR